MVSEERREGWGRVGSGCLNHGFHRLHGLKSVDRTGFDSNLRLPDLAIRKERFSEPREWKGEDGKGNGQRRVGRVCGM